MGNVENEAILRLREMRAKDFQRQQQARVQALRNRVAVDPSQPEVRQLRVLSNNQLRDELTESARFVMEVILMRGKS